MARAPRKVNRKTASQLLDDHLSEDFEMERPVKAAKGSDKGEIVRVWWEPTRDKDRTGFAGAYWPAKVVRKTSRYLEVEYDNGERDKCDPDNIFPHDVPIDFGKEVYDLQVGEFVEVSNNSTTDPCAWLGCVASVGKKYLIDYPFHDSPSEYIRPELLRRARVWDEVDWKYIQLGQKWKPGDVASPLELNLLTDDDYFQQLKQTFGGLKSSSKVKADADAAAAESAGEAAASSQDDEQQQAAADEQQKSSSKKRSRSRKPDKPSRAALDEASNGSGDDKPKGAKKRKPTSVRQAIDTSAATELQQQTAHTAAIGALTGGLKPRKDVYYDLNRQVTVACKQHEQQQQMGARQEVKVRVARASFIEVIEEDWYNFEQPPSAEASVPNADSAALAAGQQSVVDASAAGMKQQVLSLAAAAAAAGAAQTAVTALEVQGPAQSASPEVPEVAGPVLFGDHDQPTPSGVVAACMPACGNAGQAAPAAEHTAVCAAAAQGTGQSQQHICDTSAADAEGIQQATAGCPSSPQATQAQSTATDAAENVSAAVAPDNPGPALPQETLERLGMLAELAGANIAGASTTPSDSATADELARAAARSSAESAPALDDPVAAAAGAVNTAAAAVPYGATGAAAVAGASEVLAVQAGSATAPISFSDLMQNLQQPVWLMPAVVGGQQGPAMLLLPKGCSAGAAGGSAVAVPSVAAAAATAMTAGAGVPLALAALPHGSICTTAAPQNTAVASVDQYSAATAVDRCDDLEVLQVLSQLDLTTARLALSQRYSSKAYLMLVDCWRQDSPKLQAAVRSYKAHMQGQEQPDFEAFMVGIFGLERMQELELPQQQ